jgi:hypothetical protein
MAYWKVRMLQNNCFHFDFKMDCIVYKSYIEVKSLQFLAIPVHLYTYGFLCMCV